MIDGDKGGGGVLRITAGLVAEYALASVRNVTGVGDRDASEGNPAQVQ